MAHSSSHPRRSHDRGLDRGSFCFPSTIRPRSWIGSWAEHNMQGNGDVVLLLHKAMCYAAVGVHLGRDLVEECNDGIGPFIVIWG